jgi:hypothetical protein
MLQNIHYTWNAKNSAARLSTVADNEDPQDDMEIEEMLIPPNLRTSSLPADSNFFQDMEVKQDSMDIDENSIKELKETDGPISPPETPDMHAPARGSSKDKKKRRKSVGGSYTKRVPISLPSDKVAQVDSSPPSEWEMEMQSIFDQVMTSAR